MTVKKSLLNLLTSTALVLSSPLVAAQNNEQSDKQNDNSEFKLTDSANSRATSGWYAQTIGGWGWLGNTTIGGSATGVGGSATGVGGSATGEATYKGGFAAGMSGGYDFGRWRLAAEYLYQTNDANSFDLSAANSGLDTGTSPINQLTGGDFSSVAVSANLIRELNLISGERAKTYAGVGFAWLQEVDIDINSADGERSFSTDDFGVQIFVGVDYRLSRRWSASLEARYLKVGELDLQGEGREDLGTLSADYDRTSLLLGLTYKF